VISAGSRERGREVVADLTLENRLFCG
jgi:hypothetical protein